MMEKPEKRSALIIGAGIYGLITAKSLLYDSGSFFHSVEIFEKNTDLGGVWAQNRIYEGLTTNSPLLTYEIPGFPYPEELRKAGSHVKAQDVNSYLKAYAERFDLTKRIRFDCRVEDVSWDAMHSMWMVRCQEATQAFTKDFSHIVVCTGLYHSSHMPLSKSQTLRFNGHIWHSCDVSSPAVQRMLGASQSVVVVGAGKSALDLATLVAQGRFSAPTSHVAPAVKLVYRRPHWLAPRKIFQNSVSFEKVLFSRFVNAWLPFVTPPDYFHYLIAETAVGQWLTRQIFRLIAHDFIRSNGQQDLPQTIPDHSLAQALSGALHVEPPGYLECVRDGRIEVCEGSIDMLQDHTARLINKHGEARVVNADHVILATGYNLALPFFSPPLLHDLGLVSSSDAIDDLNNLSYIRLYRLIAPPRAVHPPATGKSPQPYRNIALNGFAYSLLNPTVAFVAAHWISDYFRGGIQTPPQDVIDEDVIRFHAWQTACFGTHGAKGVHIGPHATLYTDQLLSDMKLTSANVRDGMGGLLRTIRDWLRPMFPEIYACVTKDRQERDRQEGLS